MLKERLKFLVKDTAIYGIASGISKFIVFLTIPIIVKQINVDEFGVWNMLTILGSVISSVAIFGMDSAVVRYYFDSDDRLHHRRVFSHGLYIQFFLVAACIAFGILTPEGMLKGVGVSSHYTSSLLILLIWVPANVLVQYFQNWFKWTFQRARFLIIALGLAIANLALLYVHLIFKTLDLNSVLTLQAVAAWIFALLGFWWCRKYVVAELDRILIRNFMHYGFPMMLIMVIGVVFPAIDRLFLVRHLTEEELGVYSFYQKIGVIMMVVVSAFQTAFGPFGFSIWDKEGARETFTKFHRYYIIATGVVALGICCVGKALVVILGTPEYFGGQTYLPYLVLGALVYGLYSFAGLGIFYSKKMMLNLLALSIGLGAAAIANLFLIPLLSETGAAMAYLIGNLAMIIIAYVLSSRYYKIDYSYVKDFGLLAIVFALMLATSLTLDSNLYLDATVKLMIGFSIYFSAVFVSLTKAEKQFIFGWLSRNSRTPKL